MSEPRESPLKDARPKVFGPHFDELVAVIEEEVNVAFAMRYFGFEQPLPDLDQVHVAAVMIADGVDEVFRVELRKPRH